MSDGPGVEDPRRPPRPASGRVAAPRGLHLRDVRHRDVGLEHLLCDDHHRLGSSSGSGEVVMGSRPVARCQDDGRRTENTSGPEAASVLGWDEWLVGASLDLLHGPGVAVGVAEAEVRAAFVRRNDLDPVHSTPRSSGSWRAACASATTSCRPRNEPGAISRCGGRSPNTIEHPRTPRREEPPTKPGRFSADPPGGDGGVPPGG